MLGGTDVRILTRAGNSSIEVAVRAIRQFWRAAVFENSLTGERYDRFRDIPFGKLDELFIYRDRAKADEWDAEGAIPSLSNTMVHVIADEGMLTVVVDEHDPLMESILAAIRSGLSNDIFCISERAEAA